MQKKDNLFYKIVRIILHPLFILLFRPKVVGLDKIPKEGRVVLAGNHTKWLDPVMLVAIVPRQVHFLAKIELFHGITKFIVKGMGCVPVNRKIHDKSALDGAIDYLNSNLCIGIFPEGTINRTEDIIMPFKIGAVKASHDTSSKLVPFIITGKYNLFGKKVKIEFLDSMTINDDLTSENDRFMNIVSNKLIEEKNNGRK